MSQSFKRLEFVHDRSKWTHCALDRVGVIFKELHPSTSLGVRRPRPPGLPEWKGRAGDSDRQVIRMCEQQRLDQWTCDKVANDIEVVH
jgi:hypothetical protein